MNYGYSLEMSADDDRHPRWAMERETRGFDSTELWNLDVTMAKFISPRLKAFRDNLHGSPCNLAMEEWISILDKIIETFDNICLDSQPNQHDPTEGLALFAKYYSYFWQ